MMIPGVGADASSVCGPCNKEICSPVTCVAPELLTKDECNCCEQCLGVEGEVCGGRDEMRARCAPRMVCVSRSSSGSDSSSSEGTGVCVCEEDGAVCGSDGRTYSSVCTLHLHSWKSQHSGAGSVHKVHDGECTFAPIIIVTPQKIHNVTGAQVYLSCEVKAVPTPSISWRKVTESPKGIKIFEELPGDRVNVAVQVRGGPSRHESTGWVLINPLMKEDEGTYQCHATNMVGEAFADGTIKVSAHSSRRSRKSHRSSSESKV
ncbi:insulin-like growth factor-binding protein-like 1 isoform X2 [Spea bombifrons]|uniref:insulin-like growth factor-binding protein-like 1 isoform X2 n=1 Tax=Spea bombifrons TaxID=233779 RepID=UPI00234A8E2C|nr:insulin-like growth factor-binding protein-like 1 isoform X2 [Spea bombifrons]